MDTRLNEILIIGAGGMGALFGAILSKGGLQVTLVDRDIEHVEAIRANGLHISGFGGDRLQQIVIETEIGAIKRADLVLVQCKATSTAEVAESLRPIAASGAVFISFQNGLGNEEILSEILGAENVLGGLTSMAGAKLGPGHIRDFDRSLSYIGELTGGLSERTQEKAKRQTNAGLETFASTDIQAAIWKKLLGNITVSAVSGLTNLTGAQILRRSNLKAVCYNALDEALSIAHAHGILLNRDDVIHGLQRMTAPGGTGDNKSSLCLDILKKRPSEIEFIYGTPLKLAEEAGLAVPTIEALYALVKGVETHYT